MQTPPFPTLSPRGGAERAGEGRQDAWRTKAGRALAEVSMQGSHLQAAAARIAPQERVLPPDSDPSLSKLS